MPVKYELRAKSGTYTDKAGQEKNSYVRCGVLMETSKGQFIKLEALPIAFDGWIYLQEPQPRDGQQPSGQTPHGAAKASGYAPKAAMDDDEIPF